MLLVDRFEALAPLEAWWWQAFVPQLSDEAFLVVAGRRSPPPAWRRDPAWSQLVEVMPLRNLPPAESRALLHARGIPPDVDVTDIVGATHGHPLALAIAADRYVEGGTTSPPGAAPQALLTHPDAAARLLGSFIDEVARPRQRDALDVSAHARRVDRALLREVLSVDEDAADELLDWLRERPYAESHPDGLALHDVVRDVLDRDLRWRDTDAFLDLHRRIRRVVVDRMKRAQDPAAHQRAAHDLLHLHRNNRAAEDRLHLDDRLGAYTTRPMGVRDRAAVTELYARTEEAERGRAMAHWVEALPEAFTVIESPVGDLAGALATIRLDRVAQQGRAADPVAACALEEVGRRRPPEPGEVVLYQVAAKREHPDELGGAANEVAAISLRAWATPGLGWVVLASAREPLWAPMWSHIGFERLGRHLSEDGTEVGIWGRDFRRSDFSEWLESLAPLEVGQVEDPALRTSTVALAHSDFADAVRQLLRDLHRPDRVAGNPLSASRLARPLPGAATAPPRAEDTLARLRGRLVQALGLLSEDQRARTGVRAVERTYLKAAPSQERAAEVLGLPFSTYRRHLRAGIEDLVGVLWTWELHGVPELPPPGGVARG
ncbi:hypothetical protein [Trujillonella humicola]|uniref:hypothetical protein n=1 Tax=Trujillonella humicola TaxID=3383699 RepID=UPI003906A56D